MRLDLRPPSLRSFSAPLASFVAGWPRAQSAMQLASTVDVDRGQLARRARLGACAAGQADEVARQPGIDGRRILVAPSGPLAGNTIVLFVICPPAPATVTRCCFDGHGPLHIFQHAPLLVSSRFLQCVHCLRSNRRESCLPAFVVLHSALVSFPVVASPACVSVAEAANGAPVVGGACRAASAASAGRFRAAANGRG